MRQSLGATTRRLLMLLMFAATPAKSGTLHVPAAFPNIQSALNAAAATGDTIIIAVAGSPYTGDNNVNLDFQGKAVVLQSADPEKPSVRDSTIIDGQAQDRIVAFVNGEGPGAKIRGITLLHGAAPEGGAILVSAGSTPTIENCALVANEANQGGAVAIVSRSRAVFWNCLFRNNHAKTSIGGTLGEGGAAWCGGKSKGVFIRSGFIGNHADRVGGGIATADSTDILIVNSTLRRNTSDFSGGAIFSNRADSLDIYNCTIEKNVAGGTGGGALVARANHALIDRCVFTNNSAIDGGGGLAINLGPGIVQYTRFSRNSASTSGGAISAEKFSGLIYRCTVEESSITGSQEAPGGGVYLSGGTPSLVASTIHSNTSQTGGGIAVTEDARARLDNCIIDQNEVASIEENAASGGGVHISGASVLLDHCIIAENSAIVPGGAIYAEGTTADTLMLRNGILTANGVDDIATSGLIVVDVTYTGTDGTPFPGVGNINATPVFINERDQYKYVPDISSYSIDAGDGLPDAIDWCALPVDWWCGTPPDSLNTSDPDMGAYGGDLGDAWLNKTSAVDSSPIAELDVGIPGAGLFDDPTHSPAAIRRTERKRKAQRNP